mgnify:CR=1 FL=1|tara:strand:+ start:3897 stop:4058 length:162 start_codon:yes stop_codon:yes gene_type:complete
MKKKLRTIGCEHCDAKKTNAGDDVAKWICSKCVQSSMQGANLEDIDELENTEL